MHVIVGGNGPLGKRYCEMEEEHEILILDKKIESKVTYSQLSLDVLNDEQLEELDISGYSKIVRLTFFLGVNYSKSFFEVTNEEWDKMFDLNVSSVFKCIKKLYPYFSNDVSIVLCGSQNGVVGHENRMGYGESKAALIHLAKNLTVEFSKLNYKDVRINVVSPSYILTEKSQKFLEESMEGKILQNRIPNKKFISVDEVVSVMMFLHSAASKGIRGQNIVVDNGYTIV
ncbi:NAD(P)-dependent dehydrogenase (short-subunit alcohol dehydrogenase family) [Enterococcus rotai]|uniref:Oxidoreductase n=1 Tax=Enterococcus rotai TaxID=118060 RepID=A0A0U2VJJ5_9ENTE|nr:SDR family oxidoreductase [Enterococcus rotai]ALS37691.1 hypothetical protein ATZ35_11175 [Enterococcus rotai]